MDFNYYRMTPSQKIIYKISRFFKNLGKNIAGFFINIMLAILSDITIALSINANAPSFFFCIKFARYPAKI